jgi:hypothetical protein
MVYLHPGSLKGKEVPRAYDSQRISPASSKGVYLKEKIPLRGASSLCSLNTNFD